jgi:hypothetical protein
MTRIVPWRTRLGVVFLLMDIVTSFHIRGGLFVRPSSSSTPTSVPRLPPPLVSVQKRGITPWAMILTTQQRPTSSPLQSLSTKSAATTGPISSNRFGGMTFDLEAGTAETKHASGSAPTMMMTTMTAILVRSVQASLETVAPLWSTTTSWSSSLQEQFLRTFRRVWWMMPLVLALVPPYCAITKGTCAAMPDCWRVVNMGYIAAAENAHWVIGPFLASNISYLWSGAYLMHKFRLFRGGSARKRRWWRGLQITPNRFAMLGVWVALAGLISTIFHSVQALGSHSLAESLCYIDHAVAMSAILYFFDTCGVPSKSVSLIGALAIVTLVITAPGYAWLHSTWHYLSAVAATRWALEGYESRQPHHHPQLPFEEPTTTTAEEETT